MLRPQKNQATFEAQIPQLLEKYNAFAFLYCFIGRCVIFKLFRAYNSRNFGKPYTFSEETYEQFKLTTIKNINKDGKNVGYVAITENANDVRAAIQERETFIIRTAIVVAFVILIFSFVIIPGILIARPGPGNGCREIIS